MRRPPLPAIVHAALRRALLVLVALVWPAAAAHAQTVQVTSALSVEADTPTFPTDRPARTVGLPDEWAESRPDGQGPVWYRVTFTPERPVEADDLLALYIARVCANLEVYVNGKMVHLGGRMRPPVTHNCNHPQLMALPTVMIQPGVNTIDIKVVGKSLAQVASRQRAGALSALAIGPQPLLARVHARQTALQVGIPQGISATLALMGSFMFVIGWFNRRESHMAYFGALSVGWAIIESRLWVRELPILPEVAEFLLAATIPFITFAAVQFLLRYAGHRERWLDVALPAQCALIPLTLVFAGPDHLNPLARFWYTLLALEVLAAGAFYLRRQWHVHRRTFWIMAVLLGVVTLAVLVEFVGLRMLLPSGAAVFAQTAPPIILVVVGLRLMQQHGRALQEAEDYKEELEARVAAARAEIEHSFQLLSEMRVEQITERERKRIAADLHDDLGAKLLTIVHTSESERISTLAREALEEMRLSVRGLTGKPVKLEHALGDWRAEVVSRLSQAGIEGEWSMPTDNLPQTLSARAFVQTTRILREAVSNIIKHSGASRCAVRAGVAEGDFQLVIQDNGNGIPMELDGRLDRGHGMTSMKHRAKQLHGQCLVESGPGYGTVIRLTLPLERAVEPAARAL
jgi:signal transduction histidine kinase